MEGDDDVDVGAELAEVDVVVVRAAAGVGGGRDFDLVFDGAEAKKVKTLISDWKGGR